MNYCSMLQCLYRTVQDQDTRRVFFASGTGGAGSTADKEKKSRTSPAEGPLSSEVEDEKMDRKAMTSDQLRSEFARQLLYLSEQPNQASQTLDEIKTRTDIGDAEKTQLLALYDLYTIFLFGRKPILQKIQQQAKDGTPVDSITEDVRRLQQNISPKLALINHPAKASLDRHFTELKASAEQSAVLQKFLNDLTQLNHDYAAGKINNKELLRRWKQIWPQTNFGQDFLAEYAETNGVLDEILSGLKSGKISRVKIGAVSRHAEFLKALEEHDQFAKEIPDRTALENKIAQDLGLDRTKVKLKPGASFKMDKKTTFRVVRSTNDSIVMHPNVECTPAELYEALIRAGKSDSSGIHGENKPKLSCIFIPAMSTQDDLETAIGLVKPREKLRNGTQLESKKEQEFEVEAVNESKGQVTVLHSKQVDKDTGQEKWKRQKYSFPEFYELYTNANNPLRYLGREKEEGSEHSVSRNIISDDPNKGNSRTTSLISIAGVIQSVKWLNDAIKRMGTERTEVDASNYSRKLAHYMEYIPWLKGIENISMASNNELVIGKVDKWAGQYQKALKTNEFDVEWKKFYKHNKIRQAALCIAAGKRGASEEEIYWKLGGDPQVWPSHSMVVSFLKQYFCTGPDALPEKVESLISTANGEGYQGEIKKGIDDTIAMATPTEVLDMLRVWKGKNQWKRARYFGGLTSLMKLGCDANQLGIAQLWAFKAVEGDKGDGKGGRDKNNFCEEMMRHIGNSGKAFFPMLGLFRVPDGMATVRAMTDHYMAATGGNVWKGGSVHEEIMGWLFAGRWPDAERLIKDYQIKISPKDLQKLKYLYFRCRMFGMAMSEGGEFAMKYNDRTELDEDTLGNAYGVSGMMSESWLKEVISAQRPHGKPSLMVNHKEKQFEGWCKMVKEDLKNGTVTLAEQKLFAAKFASAYNQVVDVEGRKWYYMNNPSLMFSVFKLLEKSHKAGHKFKWSNTVDKEPQYADTIEEIEATFKKKLDEDPSGSYRLTDIFIDDGTIHATEQKAEELEPMITIGKNKALLDTGLDINMGERIKKIQNEDYEYELGGSVFVDRAELASRAMAAINAKS